VTSTAKTETRQPATARSAERVLGLGPVWIAAALYAAVTGAILIAAAHAAGGHFAYPLDDTYIGMAIAKNLAWHGVWGVTRYSFSSSDSSILMPLLLAGAYRLVGTGVFVPLALSWIFGLLSIFVAGPILARFLSAKGQMAALIAFVLLPPLFLVGVLGMEHSLHLLLTLLFLEYFFDEPAESGRAWRIGVVTALMVGARYEGLFFAAPACAILLLERRWKPALAVGVGAAIPVGAYAAFSIAHGGAWLPNSVALKGAHVHRSLFGMAETMADMAAKNVHDGAMHLILLLAGLAVAATALLPKARRRAIPLILVVLAGCCHLLTAKVGVLFRYEDYLIGAGIVCAACALPALRQTGRRVPFLLTYCLLLAAGGALAMRSLVAAVNLPVSSRNIYLQQVQMARFLHDEFPRGTIAANDIGAIDYFNNDLHLFDLVGLASRDVFEARRAGRYTTEYIRNEAAAHHVQIAIVYDAWFANPPPGTMGGPALPGTWVRVERWKLPKGPTVGDLTVSFYAVDPAEAAPLRNALAQFDPTLPKNVTTMPN